MARDRRGRPARSIRVGPTAAVALMFAFVLSGCSADNASMKRTQGAVPDLRCDYGAPCGKTPGVAPEGSISR